MALCRLMPKPSTPFGRQLLHQDDFVAVVAAGAAVLFRHGQAKQARLTGLVPHLAVDDAPARASARSFPGEACSSKNDRRFPRRC
jgi:hypothetical protein